MELKKTEYEKLIEMEVSQCRALGETPKASVYSAIRQNRKAIEELGMKFRVQTDAVGAEFVCRVK